MTIPGMPQDREFMERWVEALGELIADGRVKPHAYEVREEGPDRNLDGLGELKEGWVSW
jgi:hypothetical protein